MTAIPTFADVLAAAARIAPYAHVTPVMRSRALDALAGCEIHFKCENLQRIGAFKFRGAANAIFSLPAERLGAGIVTQSSGNHGAALALAASLRGAATTVVVPRNAPTAKLEAMRAYGAELVLCEPVMAARNEMTAQVLADTGGTLVHPFNDPDVIAGQGTATLELLQAVPGLDMVVAPLGGGGLLSGTAIAAAGVNPAVEVIGAEPSGAADGHDSLASGSRISGRTAQTVCDGLRGELGPLTFATLQAHAPRILLADDEASVQAMRLIWTRMKLVVEPSAALALAVVLVHRERFAGKRVGIVLSGGNVDLDALPWAVAA